MDLIVELFTANAGAAPKQRGNPVPPAPYLAGFRPSSNRRQRTPPGTRASCPIRSLFPTQSIAHAKPPFRERRRAEGRTKGVWRLNPLPQPRATSKVHKGLKAIDFHVFSIHR
ncbi:MAG: hypothetical protein LBI87_10830, partial [Candidatus Accumulibacter sp.]|nr:hypothetical protein [Accumulibacter sp.]